VAGADECLRSLRLLLAIPQLKSQVNEAAGRVVEILMNRRTETSKYTTAKYWDNLSSITHVLICHRFYTDALMSWKDATEFVRDDVKMITSLIASISQSLLVARLALDFSMRAHSEFFFKGLELIREVSHRH